MGPTFYRKAEKQICLRAVSELVIDKYMIDKTFLNWVLEQKLANDTMHAVCVSVIYITMRLA